MQNKSELQYTAKANFLLYLQTNTKIPRVWTKYITVSKGNSALPKIYTAPNSNTDSQTQTYHFLNWQLSLYLKELRTFSTHLKQQSGVDNPYSNFMAGFFSNYKGLVFLVWTVMVSIFVLCGYCCILCIRSLCEKTIETAIRRHTQDNNALQLNLMTGNSEFCDGDDGYSLSWLWSIKIL